MPVNASEEYLLEIGRRSFLRFWSYPNPFWSATPGTPPVSREELCDLLVVFEDSIVVFSDKSNGFPTTDDKILNWKRWYRRVIADSAKQLRKAKNRLQTPSSKIFQTHLGDELPIDLPTIEDGNIFLVAVARTAGNACFAEFGRRSLTINSRASGDEGYLCVGTHYAGEFIHVFDECSLDVILSRLDTARDFISYLKEKQRFLSQNPIKIHGEENLLSVYLGNPVAAAEYKMPDLPQVGEIEIPDGFWVDYEKSERARQTRADNKTSYTLDNIINQFAGDVFEGRLLMNGDLPISKHEQAFRILASESRFGRRLLASCLYSILDEPDQSTTWFSAVASKDVPGCYYLWMTYPEMPNKTVDEIEERVLSELTARMLVLPSQFPSRLVVGLAVPGRMANANSILIRILQTENWTSEEMAESERLAENVGRFDPSKSETKLYFD